MDETGVANVADPLGGSWYVEALTDEMERQAEEIFGRIKDMSPDGTITQHTGQFQPGILVDQPAVRDTTTLATRWRSAPEWVLVALAVGAVGIGVVARRRGRGRKDEHG